MRLVTRGAMDGLVSAVLLTTMENVNSLELIHPQDITDNKFEVKEGDILANLPYHPNCAMWFDHHESTDSNRKPPEVYKGKHAILPSMARVVYEYYRSEELKQFEPLVAETDRFDSAQLTIEDISDPRGDPSRLHHRSPNGIRHGQTLLYYLGGTTEDLRGRFSSPDGGSGPAG